MAAAEIAKRYIGTAIIFTNVPILTLSEAITKDIDTNIDIQPTPIIFGHAIRLSPIRIDGKNIKKISILLFFILTLTN